MVKDETELLQVELAVYCGKANPSWQLNKQQTQQVLTLLRLLKPITSVEMHAPQLGYRGFLLWGLGKTLQVYTDMVKVVSGYGREQYFYDKGHELEHFLIQGSRLHITTDLYNLLTRQ